MDVHSDTASFLLDQSRKNETETQSCKGIQGLTMKSLKPLSASTASIIIIKKMVTAHGNKLYS